MSKNIPIYLSVIGGAFYIIGGLVAYFIVISLGGFLSGLNAPGYTEGSVLSEAGFLFAFGAIIGLIIIIVSLTLLRSEKLRNRRIGLIINIIVAILGAINTLGGLLIGLILVIVGSVMAVTKK
jgi:uncharacterized membrane protein (UPF0136 family)